MISIDVAIIVIFLIINLFVGLYSSRRSIATITKYVIEKTNYSTTTLAVTIIATWFCWSCFYSTLSETYIVSLWSQISSFGDVLTLLIVGYIIAPQVKKFLGKISVAEVMGELYGTQIRLIAAISSILLSVGYVAVQIKVLVDLFNYFFGFSSIYAVLAGSLVITIYSAYGGAKVITFIDIIRFFIYGLFVLVFALLMWSLFDEPPRIIIDSARNNLLFDTSIIFNYNDPKFYSFLMLFLYYTIPGLDPATFQRILMAKNTTKAKKSFALAASLCLIIIGIACVIGVVALVYNSSLNLDTFILNIINHYTYSGLIGFVLIGSISMIIYTTHAYINSAAVIFAHDLVPLLNKNNIPKNVFYISRIFSIFIGVFATFLALSVSNLYDLLLLAGNFYTPIITIPLLLAIYGFRTTPRVALIAVVIGSFTVIIWRIFIQPVIAIDSIIPGTIANLVTLILTHYLLNEPGGWVSIKDNSQLRILSHIHKYKLRRRLIYTISKLLICFSGIRKFRNRIISWIKKALIPKRLLNIYITFIGTRFKGYYI